MPGSGSLLVRYDVNDHRKRVQDHLDRVAADHQLGLCLSLTPARRRNLVLWQLLSVPILLFIGFPVGVVLVLTVQALIDGRPVLLRALLFLAPFLLAAGLVYYLWCLARRAYAWVQINENGVILLSRRRTVVATWEEILEVRHVATHVSYNLRHHHTRHRVDVGVPGRSFTLNSDFQAVVALSEVMTAHVVPLLLADMRDEIAGGEAVLYRQWFAEESGVGDADVEIPWNQIKDLVNLPGVVRVRPVDANSPVVDVEIGYGTSAQAIAFRTLVEEMWHARRGSGRAAG